MLHQCQLKERTDLQNQNNGGDESSCRDPQAGSLMACRVGVSRLRCLEGTRCSALEG